MRKKFLFSTLFVGLVVFLGTALQAHAAVKVRVQPSGPDIPSAYVLSGETRTYFGNVEGAVLYDYRWEFSNGGDTAWANVGDPRYISIDHVFGTAGLHWARLSVRDRENTSDVDSATIEVQVLAVDTQNRQKNSAVDKGLRRLYLLEQTGPYGSYWGGGNQVGQTSMALIALENHGHNLEASDDDIYKNSTEEGLRWLFNNAYEVSISVQPCIGDPEGVVGDPLYDDGDMDNDGAGIMIAEWNEGYEVPLAMLAIINSCEKATAQTLTASSTSSAFVDGMTYWDIIVDAKDFLAYAQTDGGPGTGEGQWGECGADDGYSYYWMGSCEYVEFYVETYDVPPDCDNARLRIDYGDGTVEEGVSWCTENYAYYYTYHGYNPSGGPYTATTSYTNDDGATWTEICSFEIECVEAGDCVINGWRYVRNDTSIDNSVSQWPTLALEEAKDRWDIDVNPQVVTQFQGWLEYSQCDNGGFGYDSPCSWVNFAKTGAGLAMLKWAGYGPGDTNVQDALSFLDSTWDSTCYDGNLGEFYAMYAFYKGMKYLGLSNLNGRAWEDLYTQYLIANQSTDGSWYDCGSWIPNPDMTTAIALAILAPAVAGLPPVADADGPYGPVNPGQNVLLDGSGSFHQDPTKVLVLYEWDFDASDGLWWDSAPAPDPGEGAVGITPTTSYPDTGADETYTVTLRVTDNSDPVMTDEDTSEVSVTTGNVPPVAQTNGPWAGLPGDTITFDATSSYDPNAGPPLNDYIASYEWDLDGDGVYNEAGGDDGTPVTPGDYSIVQKTYPSPVSQTVTLRVTDSFGLSDETSPQVSIVSIALVYGQDYDICFRDMINRFQQRLGIVVLFRNDGNATAENVVMTLTQTPTNLTILQDTAVLGTMGPGDEVSTACDPGAMTADIEVMLDRRIPPAGDWRWKAEFDVDGQHFILNNLPPIGP